MTYRIVSARFGRLSGALALGAIALAASAAPALADVVVDPSAPPAVYAPASAPAPTSYTYTYTYTDPAPVVAPAPSTTTTTTTYSTVPTAPVAPPPARVEVIPPAPAAQMVWQAGYWSYNGANWDWIAGHYVAQPRPAAQWIPGHWAQQPGGAWVWIGGRWT
jgi:hypothetical protein